MQLYIILDVIKFIENFKGGLVMNNTYNARISYKGENSFTFTLPNYGELTVYTGKDIYIKGLSVAGVELLRELRPLMLEHQLNAKPDGCYRVIDLGTVKPIKQTFERAYKEPAPQSVADLKASLIKTTGPIVDEEPKVEIPKIEEVTSTGETINDLAGEKIEAPKVEEPRIIKKSNKRGNKIKSKRK